MFQECTVLICCSSSRESIWGSNISFVTSTRKKTNGGHSCKGFISLSPWIVEIGYHLRTSERRPKAMAFSTWTSSDAGRDPVAVTTSREVAEGDFGELSPRSIWEGKAGSGSAHGPPSHTAERYPLQSNECPPTPDNQLSDETTTH